MSAEQHNQKDMEERNSLAAEVLELGESQFELALEAGTQQRVADEETDIYPVEEIEAASREFFTALRLLLGMAE